MPATSSRRVGLAELTPLEQLRAGRLVRRLPQLLIGLWLFGAAMAMILRSNLGLGPWDVLHQGLSLHLPLTIGTVAICVGALVLLLWIPLRQWPGLGTVLNIFVIGIAMDATLAWLHTPDSLAARIAFLLGGIVLNGLAGGLYIGSQFGPGPRDGLMTGFSARTGASIRLVRTTIEIIVLSLGWLLGGTVGIGTVAFALLIGPATQFFLPLVTVALTKPDADGRMAR